MLQSKQVIGIAFKITETGKHVHDRVKRLGNECFAHILLVKFQVLVFKLTGKCDAGRRNIKTRYRKTLGSQISGMPATTTGQV